MCCQDDEALDLPPAVIEALAHYRRLREERGWDWGGEDLPEFFRCARFSRIGDVMTAAAETGDWAAAVASVLDARGGDPGVLRIRHGEAVPGPRRLAVVGCATPVDLLIEGTPGDVVDVDGQSVPVSGSGLVLDGLEVDGARPGIRVEGVTVPAVDVREGVELTVRADDWSRWSVLDDTGGAWFPDGVPPKWDGAHRPFFHAREATLTVPAAPLTITCARGPEFTPETVAADPAERPVVGMSLQRTHHPASDGWYSATCTCTSTTPATSSWTRSGRGPCSGARTWP